MQVNSINPTNTQYSKAPKKDFAQTNESGRCNRSIQNRQESFNIFEVIVTTLVPESEQIDLAYRHIQAYVLARAASGMQA